MTLPKGEYQWNGQEPEQIAVIEHEDHYQVKQKIKIKKVGDDIVLNVGAFFAAMQSAYALFQPLNPSSDAPQSASEIEQYDPSYQAVPYIWYGSTFDTYDYDSFDYADSGDMIMDDEGATVFDS